MNIALIGHQQSAKQFAECIIGRYVPNGTKNIKMRGSIMSREHINGCIELSGASEIMPDIWQYLTRGVAHVNISLIQCYCDPFAIQQVNYKHINVLMIPIKQGCAKTPQDAANFASKQLKDCGQLTHLYLKTLHVISRVVVCVERTDASLVKCTDNFCEMMYDRLPSFDDMFGRKVSVISHPPLISVADERFSRCPSFTRYITDQTDESFDHYHDIGFGDVIETMLDQ